MARRKSSSEAQPRERPIIFGAESVRAILAGTKTQTRRVITKPERYERIRECGFCCPYGKPGDRLWVREAWNVVARMGTEYAVVYAADPNGPERICEAGWEGPSPELDRHCTNDKIGKFQTPIFMPRWASRLTLQIEQVRAQRLQEISHEDAMAEGAEELAAGMDGLSLRKQRLTFHQIAFSHGWDRINGRKPGSSWDDNPWVWALTFFVMQS